MRGELSHGSKAHRYAACGKCGVCASTVRVLTRGDLRCFGDALGSRNYPASVHPGCQKQERTTGCTNWWITFGIGWDALASAKITDHSRNWMNGCAVACACATGNSGVGRAPRLGICGVPVSICKLQSSMASVVTAIGTCPEPQSSSKVCPTRG